MALQNFQYDRIMREYSRRQSKVRREQEARRADAYKKIPRLSMIDGEVASLSAQKARALLTADRSGTADGLKKAVAALSAERTSLLKKAGLPKDYLEPHFFCPFCEDTGYLADGSKCRCFKRAEADLLRNQSHLGEILEKENFEHFSFEWYSDTIKSETTGLTARETARRAYDSAREFVREFDSSFRNLFLYGNTGVGKTFLSHCIAQDLLKSGRCVLYFSAFDLFDRLAEDTFSRQPESGAEDSLIFDCDLLIVDDLGTELTNSFVSSRLFLCINERLIRRKSTIISTNLTLEDFSAVYSERTFSRIAANYQMLKLIGPDIRIEKLFST